MGSAVVIQEKRAKLRYIHRNPVRRGLVPEPELWRWSSYRSYALGESGMVTITKYEDLPDIPIILKKRDA